MPDERNVTKSVAKADHLCHPACCTNDIEREETSVMHLANSRNECCKRSDDRDELCVDDRLPPVTFVKRVCAVKILPPEYLRVTPEQPIADRGSKKKANSISSDRRGVQESDDHTDL